MVLQKVSINSGDPLVYYVICPSKSQQVHLPRHDDTPGECQNKKDRGMHNNSLTCIVWFLMIYSLLSTCNENNTVYTKYIASGTAMLSKLLGTMPSTHAAMKALIITDEMGRSGLADMTNE